MGHQPVRLSGMRILCDQVSEEVPASRSGLSDTGGLEKGGLLPAPGSGTEAGSRCTFRSAEGSGSCSSGWKGNAEGRHRDDGERQDDGSVEIPGGE